MRALAILCVVAACGGKGDGRPTSGPAGEVVQVTGAVTATRAAAGTEARALAAGTTVFVDDTVTTGADGSVDIRIAHNGAIWKLGAGESRRVDASAAWRAPRGSSEGAVFASADDDRTVAAGRHGDDEPRSAETAEAPGSTADGIGTIGRGASGGRGGGSGQGAGYGSGLGMKGDDAKRMPRTAAVSDVVVEGALEAATIRRALRTRKPAFGRCIDIERKRDPEFTATVTVTFSIDATGRMSPPEVTPDVSESFTACLKGAMRAMPLPESAGDTAGSVKLVFGE